MTDFTQSHCKDQSRHVACRWSVITFYPISLHRHLQHTACNETSDLEKNGTMLTLHLLCSPGVYSVQKALKPLDIEKNGAMHTSYLLCSPGPLDNSRNVVLNSPMKSCLLNTNINRKNIQWCVCVWEGWGGGGGGTNLRLCDASQQQR